MDAAPPPNRTQADLNALVAELGYLRNLLVTLSLQLSDIQFESDSALRANAVLQTNQLLKTCQSHVA